MKFCRFGIWRRRYEIIVAAGILLLGLSATSAQADGNEELGPPSIVIAEGTSIVAAGTGMTPQPGTIDLFIPPAATVKQVLLYWQGFGFAGQNDSTITIGSNSVTGTLIGGPNYFYANNDNPSSPNAWYSSTFRADITGLNLIQPGSNTLTVTDMDFNIGNDGAGIMAIIDDGSGASVLEIRDGDDIAWIGWPEPRKSTVPQTFNFVATSTDRVATISMFFGGVAGEVSGGGFRPSIIDIKVDGVTTQQIIDELDGKDGEEWDTLIVEVVIPAGATSVTVEAISETASGVGNPASFVWIGTGFNIPGEPKAALGNCVWQDLNNDGVQAGAGENCVLGNGLEPPVPNVKVNLLVGPNCAADPENRMQTTDANGFYLFDDLEPGTYCVEFEKPGDLCEFGDPVFTAQNQGDDALDSDADPATGKTGPVTLAAGETNFTVDAGLFCPSVDLEKFTNGHDADAANGFPTDTSPGPFAIGDNKVPLVAIGGDITWTYVVTNTSSATLTNIVVTDSVPGVTVTCPFSSLAPGASMDCLATGTALDLANTAGTVLGCDAEGQGTPVPTYENEGEVTAIGPSGLQVSDVDLSHYCNPPDVMVEKFTNGHDGDDAGGIPDSNPGSFNIGDPTVAEVEAGADITWTYRVTNTGTEALENVVVIDSKGVFVNCPANTLAPGASFDCTATGMADDLGQTGGDVQGCDGPDGQGDPRPTYENLATVVGNGQTSGIQVTDDDPSHYCNPPPPPECGLTVEKSCELPPPPLPPVGKCEGKLQQYTVIWNGAGPITVAAGDGLSGSSQTAVNPGDEVTFFTDGSENDTIVNISGDVTGQSEFHVSCSDADMDGDTTTNDDQQQVSPFGRDCAKDQGDGKGDSGFINQWLLEGFVDSDGAVLDCTTEPETGAASCEFQAVAADCDFPNENPDSLTWAYTGGGCAASDNLQKQSGDLFCTGSVNGGQAVTIEDDKGNVFNVEPGGLFTTSRDASKEFTLSNAGGTETNGRHVSCSQPLQAGDVYGSLTLAALDGTGLGTDIIYSYLVSNGGPETVTGITVTDNKLGLIGNIASLQPGDSDTLAAMALISQTTTNVATVDGVGAPGAVCEADSNPVTVTVSPPPPCEASIALKELKDDAIKWTLSNDSTQRKATMETFTLVFPSDFGLIKEVKLDGAAFKAGDSATYPNGVASGQTIGPNDWTHDEPVKRQLDQGESRTLEVKFTDDDKNASEGDFDLSITFKEGCMVTF